MALTTPKPMNLDLSMELKPERMQGSTNQPLSDAERSLLKELRPRGAMPVLELAAIAALSLEEFQKAFEQLVERGFVRRRQVSVGNDRLESATLTEKRIPEPL